MTTWTPTMPTLDELEAAWNVLHNVQRLCMDEPLTADEQAARRQAGWSDDPWEMAAVGKLGLMHCVGQLDPGIWEQLFARIDGEEDADDRQG